MRTWQIRSKVRQTQEKRRRPNALQDHLQQSTQDGEANSGLVEAEVGSITLWCGGRAAGATSGGRRSIQGRGGSSSTLADEFTLDDATLSTGLSLEAGAGDDLLRLDIETTLDILKLWQLRGSEVSGEINGTSDRCQGCKADGIESSVVGNLVCSSNALQSRECDVGKLAVSNNGQTSYTSCEVSNGGQIWCGNAVHVVSVKSEGSVDGCQGRNLNARDVSEGHVGSPDQVGEGIGRAHV